MTPEDDPRSTELLVRVAVKSPDEDEATAALGALWLRGTREVLESARTLCTSPDAKQRFVGTAILGQLGGDNPVFPEERLLILQALLKNEPEGTVIGRAAGSLGELRDERAIPLLVSLRRHHDPGARYGAVLGMLGYSAAPEVIGALIELSRDTDEEVRDWATFGLGSAADTDTPEIREALADRLSDKSPQARGEALVGLAKRKDPRALPLIAHRLESEDVNPLDLEAAAHFADASLLPLLEKVKAALPPDGDEEMSETLAEAIQLCSGSAS